jgi:hypothetical protein
MKTRSKELRYQLFRLLETCAPMIGQALVEEIAGTVDALVLAEVNEETSTWVDLTMKGEAVRDQLLLKAILTGAFSKE